MACLGQELAGFLWVIGIAFVIRIIADDIGGHGAVEHVAAAFKDIFYDRRRVHRIVDRLTDELVVKWLKSGVQGQKEHSEPLDLFYSGLWTAFQARHVVHRHIVNDIRLTRFQRRDSRSVLGHLLEDNLLDLRFRSPVVIVARHDTIATPLKAHELIRPGADLMLVHLIAVLISGRFADYEAVFHAVEKKRIDPLQDKNHGIVIWSLHLDHIVEVRSLQTVLVRPHAVDGKNNVFRCKRSAVVKANAFTKAKHPVFPLEFPRLGQDSGVAHRVIENVDQWLENVLPHSINKAAAMIIGIEGVGDARAENGDALFGGGPSRYIARAYTSHSQ